MLAVVDSGIFNAQSIEKALTKLGIKYYIARKPEELEKSTKIILPGVGCFSEAVKNLQTKEFWNTLKKEATQNKKPILGICLGMQLLFETSEEGGHTQGLGLIKGHVKKFNNIPGLRYPHVGWNSVKTDTKIELFDGIEQESNFYFVHGYHATLDEKTPCGLTDYGYPFVSAVKKDNIYGVQFHPEKSQKKGLMILKNFVEKC